MRSVDEILASGRYTDRRGTVWDMCRVTSCERVGDWWSHCGPDETDRHITADQMRLLIERDMHRDECVGLRYCECHPVPNVVHYSTESMFVAWDAGDAAGCTDFATLPEAMGAARALAVES